MRSAPSASQVTKVSFAALIVAAACSHSQVPTGNDDGASGSSGASGAGNNTSGGAAGTGNTAGTTSGAAGTNATGGTGQGGTAGTPTTGGAGGSAGTEVVIGGTGGAAGAGGPGGMAGMPMKMSCGDGTFSDKYTPGQQATPDPQAATMLSRMNLTQKIAQMQGTSPGSASPNYDDIQRSPDDTTNMIRGYMYRDGPRGVNLDARQPGRPYMNNYATAFPQVSARGASFDLDLEYRIGEAHGDETIASQNTMMLAPCMNLLRHPAWGRSQETYSEDSWHMGRIASAYTAGLQTYVAGCAKHYAGNNVEDNRAANNAQMDEQTLREIYGRHFEMVVREGGVACIMAAYNKVNGTKATQNAHLLNDILRTDFGFKGFVLSDWWAMPGDQNSMLDASTRQNNAAGAVNAGMDVELPWNLNYAQLQAVVDAGRVQASVIDTSARRILEQKFRFKSALLGQPIGLKTPTTTMTNGSITNNDAHITLAQEAAAKSMVLLKNANNTLPIKGPMDGGTIDKIAVIGADVSYSLSSSAPEPKMGTVRFAVDQPLGDRGSSRVNSDPAKTTGPAAGIMAAAGRHGATVVSGNSATAVGDADFVVVVVGLTQMHEGEEYAIESGGDRANFTLPGNQDALVTAVAALGKPFVVVIESGSVVDLPWLASAPAVVMAWYPGQAGGAALGQLLFGEANFSGKLPMTWGSYADFGTFNGGETTNMDYFVGYRRFDQMGLNPVFPFGHGLSYSTFVYSNLQVPCSDVTKKGVVNVTVDIQNTSAVPGDEVAFLFVGFPSAARRPNLAAGYKELKGFYKVHLNGMEAKRITIPLRVADLKYWSGGATGSWVVESGAHTIMVGPSSKASDLMLRDTLLVQ